MRLTRWQAARAEISASISNFPIKEREKEWLEKVYDTGGDFAQATSACYPHLKDPDCKTRDLRKKLAPYLVQAGMHYTVGLLPRCTGVIVELMESRDTTRRANGEVVPLVDAKTRLAAAQFLIDKGLEFMSLGPRDDPEVQRLADAVEKAAQSLEDLVQTTVRQVGFERALAVLGGVMDQRKLESILGALQAQEHSRVVEINPNGRVDANPDTGGAAVSRGAGGASGGAGPRVGPQLLVQAGAAFPERRDAPGTVDSP